MVWAYQRIGGDEEGEEEEFMMAEIGLFAMKRDQINRAIRRSRSPGSRSTSSRWVRSPCTTTSPSTRSRHRGGRHRRCRGRRDRRGGGEEGQGRQGLDRPARHRRRQHRPGRHRRHPDLAAERADRRQPLHPRLDQGAEADLRQGRAPEAQRHQGPRPASIFTAMRGIFNDFASEINRSIGFYSSVNRTAKISKMMAWAMGSSSRACRNSSSRI